jgi:O-antigen/teichoic acid export membrane protein
MTGMRDTDERVARALKGLFGRDSLYMAVWALQLVAAATLTPVITRVIGTEEFGTVAAAIAVMQVLFVIAGLGLRTAIQRHYSGPDGAEDARRLLMLTVILATLVTVVIDSTGPVWSNLLGFHSYGGALRLAVYWAGGSAVTNASLALLRSQDRLLAFSCVSVLQSVVATAAGLVLLVVVQPTATMFVLAQVVLQLTALAVALVLAPPKLLRPRDARLARTALVYALPLVPAVLSTFVLSASDRLIVQAELGLTAVARYQIAYNVGDMPMLLLGVLSVSWMPRIFALDAGGERTAVLAASRDALYRLLIPVIVGLAIGSPLVLRIWAPAEYRPNDLQLVTALVIVSAIPYTAGLSARCGLLAAGRTGMIAGATGVAAVSNIVLNLLLVPHFELVGSAVATFLSYAVLHGLLLLRMDAAGRIPRGSPRRLLEVAASAAVALAGAALPTATPYLLLRGLVVVLSVAWFLRVLIQLNRWRPTPAEPDPVPPGDLASVPSR